MILLPLLQLRMFRQFWSKCHGVSKLADIRICGVTRRIRHIRHIRCIRVLPLAFADAPPGYNSDDDGRADECEGSRHFADENSYPDRIK